jgi:hypothetical protein
VQKIMQMGLASVWDFQTEAWIPINLEEKQLDTMLYLEKS